MNPNECKYCLMPRRIDNHQCETQTLREHIDYLLQKVEYFETLVKAYEQAGYHPSPSVDDSDKPGLVSDDPYRAQQPPEVEK